MHERAPRRGTRALAATLLAVVLAGCGEGSGPPPIDPASTLERTLTDPDGDGVLETGPGEPPVPRTELAPQGQAARTLLTIALISDPHLVDEESPLRAEIADRVGGSVTSAFRPHEALTPHVLEAAAESVRRLRPDTVILAGDLIDNNQRNELEWALSILGRGTVTPDSGSPGYDGVQSIASGDPLFYRPDIDAPRHPGLLDRAQEPFAAAGLGVPWLPAVSNHDVLVQGLVPATSRLAREATGTRKIETVSEELRAAATSGVVDRARIEALLAAGAAGRFRSVAADPERRPLGADGAVTRIARAAGVPTVRGRLVYTRGLEGGVRLIVLDTANRAGGSDGVLPGWQAAWLGRELRRHRGSPILVVSPTPLEDTAGGGSALALLDRTPGVLAVVSGDTHRNRITPRRGPAGGYWLVRAPSLVDHPQQIRALRVVELADGRLAIETWLIDHAGAPGRPGPLGLAGIARELAFLDTQGGRPRGWAGRPEDRNALLFLPTRRG